LSHLAAPLRQHFQVISLPTEYSPTVMVPNHTGILDGSLTGSVLAPTHWIDGAAIAFLAREPGGVVTTLTGDPRPRSTRVPPIIGLAWSLSRHRRCINACSK
jgi:myo-inositol-1(or 4)-monophosphatase